MLTGQAQAANDLLVWLHNQDVNMFPAALVYQRSPRRLVYKALLPRPRSY